ncbi:phenylacetate--CoA ligase family protein [Aromatoleum diolicum]|uniref:AMP-binding protein n=1 Tax=Aromatoleum diolicum TaxID=75796 RepID=A0ABX1QFC7_9RHOO|nr:AMP-binding protein [Aromatoleum diolicum]NMG76197.1 AMP-binding protein [Aromatoleum diolicum]
MTFYDARETRDPAERERELMARLPAQIAHAKANAPAFARLLEGVEPAAVTSREVLARLPVTRKSELLEHQKAARPFGGFSTARWGAGCRRVFASPGPLYEPEGARPDYYRLARALFAAGFREGDLVHNTFSYHFTPAGSMMETAAHALGCTVFPAGVGQTEQQVAALADLQPNAYVGTPSFLRIILDKADELGVRQTFTKAFVSGEAFPPSVRDAFAARGIAAAQAYATADIGLIAYETPAREGMVLDEDIILEIVRPGTGDPVAPGEVGEVVITSFNPDYPLIRFGTGDLSALLPGISPCGRSNLRIKGWMGRADQTTKVKGMFVHPGQIADVVKRHPELKKARLVVDNPDLNDRMTLHCEISESGEALAGAIAASIRELTKLRGEVTFCAPGSLANDGKVIDDIRKYE